MTDKSTYTAKGHASDILCHLEALEGVSGTLWSVWRVYRDQGGEDGEMEDQARMCKLLASAVDDAMDKIKMEAEDIMAKATDPRLTTEGGAS